MKSRRTAAHHGFTLIELLIVIIVIGILAAIALPLYGHQKDRAKDAAVKEGVHTIQIGVMSYATDHDGAYPATEYVTYTADRSQPMVVCRSSLTVENETFITCLLYTSDAADDLLCVDL